MIFSDPSTFKQDKIICQQCSKEITEVINDEMNPSFIECYKAGNIPVPNFGWLCSFECAEKYEVENSIKFMRTSQGTIDYYEGEIAG